MRQIKLALLVNILLMVTISSSAQLVGKHISEYPEFNKYIYKETMTGSIKRYEYWEKTHPYFIGLQTISVQNNIILQYTFGIEAKHAIPQCTKFVQDSYYEVQNSLREGCILHQTRNNEDIYQMPDNIEVILYYNYKDGKNSYTMCSTLK